MKKIITIISAISFSTLLFFYIPFVIYTSDHSYKHTDKILWWLYTPDSIKKAPILSNDITYSYTYDIDTQEMHILITYKNITNITVSWQQLLDFIILINAVKKYNCSWVYNNPNDSTLDYQRYCVYKKGDTLQLELYQKP